MTHDSFLQYIGRRLAQHQNQEFDADAIGAWDRARGRSSERDAYEVLDELLATSSHYIKPGDMHQRLKELRRFRLNDAGSPPTPAVEPADEFNYRQWILQWRRAIADGETPASATTMADEWARQNGLFYAAVRQEPKLLSPQVVRALTSSLHPGSRTEDTE